MRMRDREELETRFNEGKRRTEQLIEAAAKDVGNIEELEFKLALSGQLARLVNVESLLAIGAELLYRAAIDKRVRDEMPPEPDKPLSPPEEFVPRSKLRDPEADPDCTCPYSPKHGRGYDSGCPQHGRDI